MRTWYAISSDRAGPPLHATLAETSLPCLLLHRAARRPCILRRACCRHMRAWDSVHDACLSCTAAEAQLLALSHASHVGEWTDLPNTCTRKQIHSQQHAWFKSLLNRAPGGGSLSTVRERQQTRAPRGTAAGRRMQPCPTAACASSCAARSRARSSAASATSAPPREHPTLAQGAPCSTQAVPSGGASLLCIASWLCMAWRQAVICCPS